MVASDVGLYDLSVSFDVLALVPAGDLSLSCFDRVYKLRIVNMQVCYEEVLKLPGTASHVLGVTHLVELDVLRIHLLLGMVVCDGLAFERRHSRLGKDLFLRTVDLDDLVCLEPDLGAPVILFACPRDRHVPANQKALASLELVRAYRVAVVCNHVLPPVIPEICVSRASATACATLSASRPSSSAFIAATDPLPIANA